MIPAASIKVAFRPDGEVVVSHYWDGSRSIYMTKEAALDLLEILKEHFG